MWLKLTFIFKKTCYLEILCLKKLNLYFTTKHIAHLEFELDYTLILQRCFFRRVEWGNMNRQIFKDNMKHLCYFSPNTGLKYVLFKIITHVKFFSMFHI
jgi:hypothetical protein